jgi:CheY-like chemotaxis protein
MSVRILIADDNASVRGAMRRVLEAENWAVVEAADGKQAVSKAVELRPNLVVLDLAMPIMNGLTASRLLLIMLPGVPILIHTLYSTPQVHLEAAKAGVRKVVPKSDGGVLVSAVRDVLESSPPKSEPSAPVLSEQSIPAMRRTEDKVREICAKLCAMKDDAEHCTILAQLQDALHQHTQTLRARVTQYPVFVERRVPNQTPAYMLAPENAAKQSAPSSNITQLAEQERKSLEVKPGDEQRIAG